MTKIFCDGGSRGNPGPAASAIVVMEGENVIHEDAKFLGVETNNVAEYHALVMALEWASENVTEDVEIVLDSELVKKQMTGEYKIRHVPLQILAMRAKGFEKMMAGHVTYSHTLREGNSRADLLVNQTLDKFNV